MNVQNVIQAIEDIVDNRNVSKELILEALQDSLEKAYRRQIGVPDALVEVEIDESNNTLHLYQKYLVVEDVEDDELEVGIHEIDETSLELGDYLRKEKEIDQLGRAAATLAKNVIKQKIREAEKKAVYDEYIGLLDDLIMAEVESVEPRFVVVNLGKSLAVMPKAAQIEGETYREGQQIKVVITDVNKETKGAQILVSRADAMLVRRLFELEVPEIYDNDVEIKAIAREAGDRTKMAVFSNDPDIDPIGACIGPRGSRVQAVIEELKGEKIDIFEWSEDTIELVKNALSPAEVYAVFPSPEGKGLMVVVEDDQLSLAIGRRGKNARLAVRLTKERIDIKSRQEVEASGVDPIALMAQYQSEIAAKLAEKAVLPVETVEEEVVEAVETVEVVETELEVETVSVETDEEKEDVVADASEPEESEEDDIKIDRKDVFRPRTEYVSKFEELADVSRQQSQEPVRRRRFTKEKDPKDEPVNNVELLKELEYEIVPEYSKEEIEEIERQQKVEENAWYEDEIDFDAYDEYYDEE